MKSTKPLLALFGGSFDPIHLGHLHCANSLLKQYKVSKFIFIPNAIAPHKQSATVSALHRLRMIETAISQYPQFEVNDIELKRSGKSYTVDTINYFANQYRNHQLLFLIGMDSLLSFTSWHQWQQILANCALVVMQRPGFDLTTANQETQWLLAHHQINHINQLHNGKIKLENNLELAISSTEIRSKIAANQSVENCLTKDVISYIEQHNLYKFINSG